MIRILNDIDHYIQDSKVRIALDKENSKIKVASITPMVNINVSSDDKNDYSLPSAILAGENFADIFSKEKKKRKECR
jgi:hypothetical protein